MIDTKEKEAFRVWQGEYGKGSKLAISAENKSK